MQLLIGITSIHSRSTINQILAQILNTLNLTKSQTTMSNLTTIYRMDQNSFKQTLHFDSKPTLPDPQEYWLLENDHFSNQTDPLTLLNNAMQQQTITMPNEHTFIKAWSLTEQQVDQLMTKYQKLKELNKAANSEELLDKIWRLQLDPQYGDEDDRLALEAYFDTHIQF